MPDYNKVLLMGRLTRDPELRSTPQGISVSEIGLAVNREFAPQEGGDRRKETTFIDVTLWRRRAEVVCQYLRKGDPIFIEGRLVLDSWENQEGQRRSKLRVVADNFQFVSSRGGGAGGSAAGGSGAGGSGAGGSGGFTEYQYPGGSEGYGGGSGGGRFTGRGGGSPAESLDSIDDSDIPF